MAESDITTRPNYFAGQYLLEDDFELEQKYYIDRQRRHNRLLHVAGITEGLEVTVNNNVCTVSSGSAIDGQGRQIVLALAKTVTVPTGAQILYIQYQEQEAPQSQQEASGGNTRILEDPNLAFATSLPQGTVGLAKFQNGSLVADPNIRKYSGAFLPSPGAGLSLRYIGNGQIPATGQVEQATLTGSLSVSGNLSVTGATTLSSTLTVTGTTTLSNTLTVTGATTLSSLSASGNLTVTGTTTLSSALTVNSTVSLKGAADKTGLTVDSNGNVGIGVAPSSTLHVAAAKSVRFELGANQKLSLGANGSFEVDAPNSTGGRFMITDTGNVGIATTSPDSKLTINANIAHDNNFNYGNAQLTIFDPTPNSKTDGTPETARDILHLVREGVANQAYGNKVSLALSRYEQSRWNSRTQLDIKLTDGNFADTTVMSLRSNGNVGIGTTSPQGFQVALPESSKMTGTPGAGVTIAGGPTGNASIELRNNGSGTPYIDFAQNASTTDYDARILLTAPGKLAIQGAKLISTNFRQIVSATNSQETTSTNWADLNSMSLTVTTTGSNYILILFKAGGVDSQQGDTKGASFQLLVDGVSKAITTVDSKTATWSSRDVFLQHLEILTEGEHTIKIQWRLSVAGGKFACSWNNSTRSLIAIEL
ncbi:hypothetical protein H6G64_32565 [Calothrix sp. FACHB-156]|nr:hypothetical protein [Calothrix sp. FACHB-156]